MKKFLTEDFKNRELGVYLASPYTHASRTIMDQRFDTIARISTHLGEVGIPHFCPILQSHIEQQINPNIPHKWDYWKRVDTTMVKLMDELWICSMTNVENSIGVKAEFYIAKRNNKPIRLLYGHKDKGYYLEQFISWKKLVEAVKEYPSVTKRHV